MSALALIIIILVVLLIVLIGLVIYLFFSQREMKTRQDGSQREIKTLEERYAILEERYAILEERDATREERCATLEEGYALQQFQIQRNHTVITREIRPKVDSLQGQCLHTQHRLDQFQPQPQLDEN